MNDELKDGGPAFPFHYTDTTDAPNVALIEHDGMSLRDWFAGQMVAPLALDCHKRNAQLPPDQFAYECYRFARAMLHERSKP